MPCDLVIRGADVVDGTGAPRRRADVAVDRGRIVYVGDDAPLARRTLDAAGLVVAPGFVDPHTHYDAQVSWDPLLDSSSEHGVTTVVNGNCGVGVAPCRPGDREVLIEDLINVEGMSKDVLTAAIRWQWETFPEYLDAARRSPCAINRAFLVALAPLRTYVLGPEACERAATPSETARLAGLLGEAMDAGAAGFSTTNNRSHIGYRGKPLAARLASRDELGAYCRVLRERNRGAIEIAVTNRFATLTDDEYALLDFLLMESGRPVTWISLLNNPELPEGCRSVLDKADALIRRGAPPQMLLRSMLREFTLQQPYLFSEIHVAKRIFNRPLEEQAATYADPAFRAAFRAELAEGRRFSGCAPRVTVVHARSEAVCVHEGRSIGEIAAERNADPLDTLFDIALEDGLRTVFAVERANNDRRQTAAMLADPRTLIGLSDGGAHVDMLYEAGYTTWLLGHWVRESGALSLEEAVRKITSQPADLFGFHDRGRVREGNAADLVVFDANGIGSDERGRLVRDLPGGGGRLHARARGISWVVCNGEPVWEHGEPTGARPGTVVAPR